MTWASFKCIAFIKSDFSAFRQKKKHICMFSLSTAVQVSVSVSVHYSTGAIRDGAYDTWCFFSCVLSHMALTFFTYFFLHTNSRRLWWHLSWLVSWSHYLFSLCFHGSYVHIPFINTATLSKSNVPMLDVYNQKKSRHLKISVLHQKGKIYIYLTSLHSCWALVNEEGSIFPL